MKILITGGVGFIGCNATQYFARKGNEIYIIDNLSRDTARINLEWMREQTSFSFNFTQLDITDFQALNTYFKQHHFDVVIHLAAQVAVTLSVQNPRYDFHVNALGTFNLLECVRQYCPSAVFINASTNKVYGKILDQEVEEKHDRYQYKNPMYSGVNELQNLDFYSPYGCSKGTADQYVLDHARIYGLRAVSVRQSCIYGPHQIGIEDQGWIAWFILAVLTQQPIKIYGNGKQVRDVLYVDDLVRFYELIIANIDHVQGKAFNIGGGHENALSLLQFFTHLESIVSHKVAFTFADWRPGDQLVFISDNTRAARELNFKPNVSWHDGVYKTYQWLAAYYGVLHKDKSRHDQVCN